MTAPDTYEQMRFIFETGGRMHQYLLLSQGRSERGSPCRDMSMAQIQAARLIREHGRLSVTELGRLLNVSAPSASAMVERLAERGLVNRERSKQDRRRVVVQLSRKAARDIERFERSVQQEFVQLATKIGPGATRDWHRVMKRIRSVIDAEMEKEKTNDRS